MADKSPAPTRLRTVFGRAWEPESSARLANRALPAVVLIYATAALWLTRNVTFTIDELAYFAESDGFAPGSIAAPFGGHLTAITRLFFEASLRLFGPEHLPFQLLQIALVAAAAVLVFLLVRRRLGSEIALAGAVLLLFLGSTPEVLQGNTTMWAQATVAGLAAFLTLDRRGRSADALACLLLVVAVLSFEVGVAFAIGAAAWIIAEGGWRRLWIAALPLALYGVWWIWALKFDQGFTTAANVLLTPTYAADSLAAAAAALTGLGIDLSGEELSLPTVAVGWGRIVAAAAVVAIGIGISRSRPTALFIGVIVFLSALWAAGALSFGIFRGPDSSRLAYPVAIGLMLLLAASFPAPMQSRRILIGALGLLAFAVPVNAWQMRERGADLRRQSDLVRARLAVIELERAVVPPTYSEGFGIPVQAARYLAASDRFGGLGFTLTELDSAPSDVRLATDETLGAIVSPRIVAASSKDLRCDSSSDEVELAPGGSIVRSEEGGALSLRRFADGPSIEVGILAAGEAGTVELPLDGAGQPWIASTEPTSRLATCSAGD